MTAHISQMLELDTIHVDGDEGLIHIETKLHLGGARIATSAVEYCINDQDEEYENELDLTEAVMKLGEACPVTPATVDGQYAVVDNGQLRVLAWENKDKVMCTMEVFKKS